jgi:hypothetical protein
MRSQRKIRRIVGAIQPGVRVDMYGSEGPELRLPDGSRQRITSSLGVYRLLFKYKGCAARRQHYRVGTCKSVKEESDLWCPVCIYSQEKWERAGKRVLPGCELWFMLVLLLLGMDTQFAFQATAPFWSKPLDAYHLQLGYFVQIDGKCHWVGMRGLSRDVLLKRGMRQNVAAVEAGGVLVRMHYLDVQREGIVEGALEAAAAGYSIVLTPSYGAELYDLYGQQVPYVHALWLLVASCWYNVDRYGNYCFWLM